MVQQLKPCYSSEELSSVRSHSRWLPGTLQAFTVTCMHMQMSHTQTILKKILGWKG